MDTQKWGELDDGHAIKNENETQNETRNTMKHEKTVKNERILCCGFRLGSVFK